MQISPVNSFCPRQKTSLRTKDSNISFTSISNPQCYNDKYTKMGYNGLSNDKFISKKIKEYFPDAKNTKILDIGAGDGRNALPLAMNGYKTTAYELSDNGRKLMKIGKKEKSVDNLRIIKHDILDSDHKFLFFDKNFFDFAFMSHVSQHFNEEEMAKVANNVHKRLKENGIFVFDALIINKDGKNRNIFSESDIKRGQYGFQENSLLKILKKSGFKLEEITNYNEAGESRAKYIDCPEWGGNDPLFGRLRKSLTLKWFILRK